MEYPARLAGQNEYKPPSDPEGEVTREVERATGRIPSSAYLGVAFAAMGIALIAELRGSGKWGAFFAQWVPTWLLLGLYSKLQKFEDDYSLRDPGDRGSYFL
jgi:hypothetical protein